MRARRADLKTGYDCNSNCLFCVIGDKLFSGDRSTAECVAELRESRKTCEDVVFTGAEVTIRPDFLKLVRAAKRLGYRNIQIQTNGRMLAYAEMCERAVAAGANEFSPSIHAPVAKVHDALTRSRGSFVQVVEAIKHLKRLGQRIVTNTVVCKQNAHCLPELATLLIELGVDQFQLAFPHPTGHADRYFDQVMMPVSEARGFVHQALRRGLAHAVSCMAEAMPFCQMQGFEQQVAELHIPPTEIVYDGYVVPDYFDDRMNRAKVRFEQCADCRFEPICEGPWREYPARLGDAEFQPVAGARVVDTEVLLAGYLEVLGRGAKGFPARPGYAFTAYAFFPESGSPGCTAQLCGVRDELESLTEQGIAVVGVSPESTSVQGAFAEQHNFGFALVSGSLAELHRAWGLDLDPTLQRMTVLVDANGQVVHVLPNVDIQRHAAQILAAVVRLQAPPRPRTPGPELVVLRRPAQVTRA